MVPSAKYILAIALLMTVLLIAGCSDKTYEQPLKTEPSPTTSAPKEEPKALEPEPVVKTFKVGETATDNRLKVTVNGVSFKDKITMTTSTTINGQDFSSDIDIKPKEGYKYLIADLTVENLQKDKTSIISSVLQFKVSDAEGYEYNQDLMASVSIDKSFKGGDLLPGMKTRGNVVFEVPQDSKDLSFQFLFEIGGQTAVFKLQ